MRAFLPADGGVPVSLRHAYKHQRKPGCSHSLGGLHYGRVTTGFGVSAGARETVIFSAVGPVGKRGAGEVCRRIAMPTAAAATTAPTPTTSAMNRGRAA